MDNLMIALMIKPFAAFLFMAGVVALEVRLRRIWPEGRLKQILFGRDFDKRHPVIWWVLCLGMYPAIGMMVWVWLQVRDFF